MRRSERKPAVLVVGLGNRFRGDDAAGVLAAQRLAGEAVGEAFKVCVTEGEPIALLELWSGFDAVVVLDAVRGGGEPGTLHRFDVSDRTPARPPRISSSHAVSALEAIELARALRRLPERVVVLGVEGAEFRAGAGMTPAVSAALPSLVRAAKAEAGRLAVAA